MTLSLFLIRENNETGKAKKLDKKISNKPNTGDTTSPTKNISFISAPPKVSFLNILFPNNIIQYINENNKAPDNKEKKKSLKPKKNNFTNIIAIEKNKVTSSGIIR